ncbi:uncharacterized protein LOC119689583 [Teleopsis dalmanni]|uniref:uncharacterized protein LOC119689583 n=1 Tax=Teleopsis dalmanni TaxID=139649 RepID=UPI0018CE8571|nr:uncharacterized protein LOC119689583 [Teleopsis dalmanni]
MMELVKGGMDDSIDKKDTIPSTVQDSVNTQELCKLDLLLCTLWDQHNKPEALKMLGITQVEKRLLNDFEVIYKTFMEPNVLNPASDMPFTAFSWFMGDTQTRIEFGNKWIRKMEQCSRHDLHKIKTNQDLNDLKELITKIPRGYIDGNQKDVKSILRNVQKNSGLLYRLQYELRAKELKFYQLEMNASEMEIFVSPTTSQHAINELYYDIEDGKWEEILKNEIENFKTKLDRKNSMQEAVMKKYDDECKILLQEISQKTNKLNKDVKRYERRNRALRRGIAYVKKMLSNGKEQLKNMHEGAAGKFAKNSCLYISDIKTMQDKIMKKYQKQFISKL